MTSSLVIGGNGFIGAKLVDSLMDLGHSVRVLDRFSLGTRNFSSQHAELVVADFQDQVRVREAVEGIDTVFHFLSATTPASAQSDPSLDVRGNVLPSLALFDACANSGVKRLVFASTGGAIYGNQSESRLTETSPTLPLSPYAIAKLTLENYLRYFNVTRGLESVSLRISNPYGPGQHRGKPQGLIPIAVRAGLTRDEILQYGDGSMIRDYLYVDDLVDMILKVALTEPKFPVYNLGSGVGHSLSEVLGEIEAALGYPLRRRVVDAPETFVDKVVLDMTRFSGEFGMPSLTPLPEGILRTIVAEREGQDQHE
jgi:UDP-glucose 4-epimerase